MRYLLFLFIGFLVAEVATLVTTVYLHRSSTHKGIEFHPAVEFIFQFILWLTTGINRKEWVAVHLCHHAHTDEEGDPHSPILLGFWAVQFGNVFLYKKATKDPKVMWYARDFKLSWAEKNIFKSHFWGLVFGIFLACYLFGFWGGLLVSLSHTIWYLGLNSLVNAYCHVRGYKNHPQAHGYNSHWVAWLTGGEGFHNDHHFKPGNPKLSERSVEFDLGWGLILFLSKLGLAS